MLRFLVQPQKKKLQLDLKTNDTQNHQKIELYGSPTTKDLKPHSSRQVGGKEMQRCMGEWCGEAWRCRMGGPTSSVVDQIHVA